MLPHRLIAPSPPQHLFIMLPSCRCPLPTFAFETCLADVVVVAVFGWIIIMAGTWVQHLLRLELINCHDVVKC